MTVAVTPEVGVGVVHLFCRPTPLADREAIVDAVRAAEADGDQVVSVALLGHKGDLGFMALGDDLWRLRRLQTGLQSAGLDVVDSYVSLTELSEYSQTLPDEMKQARLHPQLPPEDKAAWCFYPMSRKRDGEYNWFTLDYDRRQEMMMEHGKSGRTFAGRVLQVITGSCGVDDYEWGVTLFAVTPDTLKDVVYTMRFDEASADFADFGPFYTGMVGTVEEVLDQVLPG
jgi:chlorite dismutase